MTRLYRATNDQSDQQRIPGGTCWTPSRDDAQAYSDRPNYAHREHIVSIETDGGRMLDLTGDDWSALTDALGHDVRDSWTDGDLDWIEQAIDDRQIRRALSIEYDWVIYDDTYPDHCQTWVRL